MPGDVRGPWSLRGRRGFFCWLAGERSSLRDLDFGAIWFPALKRWATERFAPPGAIGACNRAGRRCPKQVCPERRQQSHICQLRADVGHLPCPKQACLERRQQSQICQPRADVGHLRDQSYDCRLCRRITVRRPGPRRCRRRDRERRFRVSRRGAASRTTT